jgi:CMP-N,N'-diacetyllegionaminic acid synthase
LKNIFAIIPARGGSKGVPRKNLSPLADKPLIAYSIEDAIESKMVDTVFVSTDDHETSEVAKRFGAEVIHRPHDIATDSASSESAIVHALEVLSRQGDLPELIVFLQCTSPFRTGKDIDQAIIQLQQEQADSLLSVSPSHRFIWEYQNDKPVSVNYDYHHRPRRQEMKQQYVENGSIYLFKPWVIQKFNNRLGGKISMYVMSEESAIDIDSPIDLKIAESIMRQGDSNVD